ncbi:MAG: DNA polymerase/3'-5' exonuclease PolX [bacterium]
MSSKVQLARLFDEMADLLELQEANPFRVRAYQRASQALEGLDGEVEDRIEEDTLLEIPGIGKDLAEKIGEFVESGSVAEHRELKEQVPRVLLEMTRIPGVGPKNAVRLHRELQVESLDHLEAACRSGAVAGLEGFGPKSQENILEGIDFVRRVSERRPLGLALPVAEEFVALLRGATGVEEVSVAGSLRRMRETIGDVDILAASADPGPVMEVFTAAPGVARVLARGETRSSIRTDDDLQVDLRVVEPKTWGAALLYFTGSKEHNIRLREMAMKEDLKVSEYGIFDLSGVDPAERKDPGSGERVHSETEEGCYESLGLPWIPPELREDTGEIQAAREGRLPELITPADIRGDLHAHTDASDGKQTLEELVEAARTMGYAYIAVTDHSRSLKIAGGLGLDRMERQIERVRELDAAFDDIDVLAGSEVDILKDGSLDYPDGLLERLDVVIASVHTHFGMSEEEQTRRVCRAMENPFAFALGHPTGRLLGERDPYDIDMDRVLEKAAETGTALEINANPRRLDLTDRRARQAADMRIPILISTDAHRRGQLDFMDLGVKVARRAWLEADMVVNTLPPDAMREEIRRKRP